MSGPRVVGLAEIELASGGIFPIKEPWRADFTVGDVALGLSNICRFGGQVPRFYSVAEHSVHCSYHVPPHLALSALCHDAAEAFLGDIPTPIKALLPAYKDLERMAESVVLPKLGARYPIPSMVKEADRRLLATEKLQVLGSLAVWPSLVGVALAPVRIEFWAPRRAARAWLARFDALGGVIF
ncbi:YfbR-like 5'-deoxynucleotidase [Falsihalocynthiibacter arcticus]|uniref:YfbR-like 5'-deoxynucleotidase n=1 Tax=Falsihalocynthiibacter arcticus TaxID=1579316 RepID=UPI003002B976